MSEENRQLMGAMIIGTVGVSPILLITVLL
jgi:hypothetical protein